VEEFSGALALVADDLRLPFEVSDARQTAAFQDPRHGRARHIETRRDLPPYEAPTPQFEDATSGALRRARRLTMGTTRAILKTLAITSPSEPLVRCPLAHPEGGGYRRHGFPLLANPVDQELTCKRSQSSVSMDLHSGFSSGSLALATS